MFPFPEFEKRRRSARDREREKVSSTDAHRIAFSRFHAFVRVRVQMYSLAKSSVGRKEREPSSRPSLSFSLRFSRARSLSHAFYRRLRRLSSISRCCCLARLAPATNPFFSFSSSRAFFVSSVSLVLLLLLFLSLSCSSRNPSVASGCSAISSFAMRHSKYIFDSNLHLFESAFSLCSRARAPRRTREGRREGHRQRKKNDD